MELRVPAKGAASSRLVLHATRSHDYGILRFSVNGKPAGADVDLYAAKPIPSGPIELGVFEPMDGAFRLQAAVVGKNPQSTGTFFGLDCVCLEASSGTPVCHAGGDPTNVVAIFANDPIHQGTGRR